MDKLNSILFLLTPKKYIFILSHMRSYSTLLAHILGSNNEISGAAELQQAYRSYKDIIDMKNKIYKLHGNKKGVVFLLDKILGENHHIDKNILLKNNIYPIYLVRKPVPSVKSIINMGHKVNSEIYKDPVNASNYYISKLRQLREYSNITKTRGLFIKSEDIKSDTNNVLRKLNKYLKLSTPLHENYEIFDYTGKERYGDPLSLIHEGKIIKKESNYDEYFIPKEYVTKIEDEYLITIENLYKNCSNHLK